MSKELSQFIVDLEKLRRNWQWLNANTNPYCQTASVVKADGYGHGIGPIATSLFEAGCRIFCVARLEEALQLRNILMEQGSGNDIAEVICFDGLQKGDIEFYPSYRQIRRNFYHFSHN